MSLSARRKSSLPSVPEAAADVAREDYYGGIVGDMIAQLEQRLAEPAAPVLMSPAPADDMPDLAHRISVAGGYVAMAAALAAMGWLIFG